MLTSRQERNCFLPDFSAREWQLQHGGGDGERGAVLGTGMGWEDGRGRGRAERREERKEDMGVSEDRGIQTGLRCQQISVNFHDSLD